MSFYVLFIRCQALTHNACKYYKKIVRLYKEILIFNNIVLTDMEVQNDRDYKRK